MADQYEVAFRDLREQIAAYSPKTVRILESIQSEGGSQAAYYAAFVIVCIHARSKVDGYRSLNVLSEIEVKDFTFFEYVRGNPQALNLFSNALQTFKNEQLAASAS